MRFQVEEGTETLTVGGHTYEAEDGFIECTNHEHHGLLRQLGCRTEDEIVAVERVKAETPPEVPEGYLTPEAATALVEENEDLIQGNKKLHEELALARGVGEDLHNRNQELAAKVAELEAANNELTGLLEEATNKLSATVTENSTETAGEAAGGESTTEAAEATETLSPPAKKAK